MREETPEPKRGRDTDRAATRGRDTDLDVARVRDAERAIELERATGRETERDGALGAADVAGARVSARADNPQQLLFSSACLWVE